MLIYTLHALIRPLYPVNTWVHRVHDTLDFPTLWHSMGQSPEAVDLTPPPGVMLVSRSPGRARWVFPHDHSYISVSSWTERHAHFCSRPEFTGSVGARGRKWLLRNSSCKTDQAVLHPNMMKRAPNQLHYNVLFNYLFLGETHPISDACLLSALFQEVISLGMAWLS